MKLLRLALVLGLVCTLAADLLAQSKKRKKKKGDEEEITQVHEIPKDPPAAVSAEPQRMGFLTAPMSSKGLLSQQVRDGLKALKGLAHGASIVKVRAFVAGSGDLRRVQAIVSEFFTDGKMALPALTTVRVGALPQFPSNALGYNLTWSTAGVINEYCQPCEAILGGSVNDETCARYLPWHAVMNCVCVTLAALCSDVGSDVADAAPCSATEEPDGSAERPLRADGSDATQRRCSDRWSDHASW